METGTYLVPLVLVLSSLDACPAAQCWAAAFGNDWDSALDACNRPEYLMWLADALSMEVAFSPLVRKQAAMAMVMGAFPEDEYADFRTACFEAQTEEYDFSYASPLQGRDERTSHWFQITLSALYCGQAANAILGLRTALRVEKKMSYTASQVELAKALRISMGADLLDGLERYVDVYGVTSDQ